MTEELKIDKRTLRGVHCTIRKVIERMNKLLVVNETEYGYSIECDDDELHEAYSSLRYVDAIIGNFLEHRKEQGNV
jgi:hypothetical protein